MPKNPSLEYEAQEPAFLRRLKAGHTTLDGRHNVQVPRARGGIGRNSRLDMHGEEGEDDPVMLDESGNVMSKDDMEKLEKGDDAVSKDVDQEEDKEGEKVDEAQTERMPRDGNVSSGFGKKRKVAKVVVDDEHAPRQGVDENEDSKPTKSLRETTKDLKDVVAQNKEDAKKGIVSDSTVKKSKRKKIKLSFDELE